MNIKIKAVVSTFKNPFRIDALVRQEPLSIKLDDAHSLRHLTPNELSETVYPWFPAVTTPNSAAATFMADAKGWYAITNSDAQVIGSIASIRKARNTAFYGWYYIAENKRGSGIAEATMQIVLERDRINGIQHICFQCFPTLEPLYNRYGFQTTHQDHVNNAQLDEHFKPQLTYDTETTQLDARTFLPVVAYDKEVQRGLNRFHFLYHWLSKPNTVTLVAEDDEGKIIGYSVISDFVWQSEEMGNEHKRIAPLYADTPEVAERLLEVSVSQASKPEQKKLSQNSSKSSIFFDTSGTNPYNAELLNKTGLFKTAVTLSNMSQKIGHAISDDAGSHYESERIFGFTDYGTGP